MERELYRTTGNGVKAIILSFLGIIPIFAGAFAIFLAKRAGKIIMSGGVITLRRPDWAPTANLLGWLLVIGGIVWFVACWVLAAQRKKGYVSATTLGLHIHKGGKKTFISYSDIQSALRISENAIRLTTRKGKMDIDGLKDVDSLLTVMENARMGR